jgi:hypothetical protein
MPIKICLQSGHKGLTSGSVGAPGEKDWTTKIVPMIAERLRAKGLEVYETDALGYNDKKVVGTDWDLFLAVHYDADVYGNTATPTGGFTDYPEPSTDGATKESQRIAKVLKDYYFKTTGIKYVNRSNANTRYYYMWQYLTEKTPCVIIECGVGWRKPEDYETLRKYDFIADTISDGILKAFGIYSFLNEDIPSEIEESYKLKDIERYNKYWTYNELINDWVKLVGEYEYEKTEKEKYKNEARDLREVTKSQSETIFKLSEEIKRIDQVNAEYRSEISKLQSQFAEVSRERDSLLNCCKDYEESIPKLKNKIKELENKLIANNSIEDYSIKELFSAILYKLFNKK